MAARRHPFAVSLTRFFFCGRIGGNVAWVAIALPNLDDNDNRISKW